VYLASLVLGDLVDGVLPAVLALAVSAASLRYVNLRGDMLVPVLCSSISSSSPIPGFGHACL